MGITKLDGRVLDFWEREFPDITPKAQKDGEKIYSRKDLMLILQIRKWMVEERFSRQEVKRLLAEHGGHLPAEEESSSREREEGVETPSEASSAQDVSGEGLLRSNVVAGSPKEGSPEASLQALEAVREGLREILRLLERPGSL